jgi:hypothetical protein
VELPGLFVFSDSYLFECVLYFSGFLTGAGKLINRDRKFRAVEKTISCCGKNIFVP